MARSGVRCPASPADLPSMFSQTVVVARRRIGLPSVAILAPGGRYLRLMTIATTKQAAAGLDVQKLLQMYRQMVAIRLFEERVNDLYTRALMPGLAHLYIGEEAVAVGVCEALRADDYITSTHRGHGHCLAKGAAPHLMFAELFGKEAGYCKGKGGSMHIADPATGNLGANAIVGGGAALATGAAYASKALGQDRVAVCFFGEGALGQGVLYESMNLAQLWKLPVIYVCENNLYNEYTHYSETTAGDVHGACRRRLACRRKRWTVRTFARCTPPHHEWWTRARRGDGPGFLLLNTYRFRGHHVGDIARDYYRSETGRAAVDVGARSADALRGMARRRKVWRIRRRWIASRAKWPPKWMPRSSSRRTRRFPIQRRVDEDVYA